MDAQLRVYFLSPLRALESHGANHAIAKFCRDVNKILDDGKRSFRGPEGTPRAQAELGYEEQW
jgi:hypothetical protein